MARSAALNPASMPFEPTIFSSSPTSRGPLIEDEFGSKHHTRNLRTDDVQRSSISSLSGSEYRTARTSPSPPQDFVGSPFDRSSPSFRQMEGQRQYSPLDTGRREPSMLVTFESNDSNTTTPGPASMENGASFFSIQNFRDRNASTTTNGTVPVSASPVSSSGGSHADHMQSLEDQIKALPMMRDLRDRLVRCEFTTREIQQNLVDLSSKVNLLVERQLASPIPPPPPPPPQSQPEFKDPFSGNGLRRPTFPQMPPSLTPRPSIVGISPNQTSPSDDISTISQRLNTLTSSVGQLLALQTQQMVNQQAGPSMPPMAGLPPLGPNGLMGPKGQPPPGNLDFMPPNVNPALNRGSLNRPPNMQNMPPNMQNSMQSNIQNMQNNMQNGGSGRMPAPPMRTWSTGNLDIPVRPPDVMGPGRDNFLGSRPPDGGMNRPPAGPLANNMAKRGSVTGIARRDSTSAIDSDNGSVITKWEQLSLEPELFASINKFGVGPPNKIQQRALPFLLRGSDIIAQAPPTQERIAAYVIPALQVALTNRDVLNPVVLLVSTTVDQANQAHRMIRDLGGPIGIRSTLIAGLSSGDISQELKIVVQNKPQVVVGTPQKLHAYFTTPNGLQGSDIRFLVLDEVDQLIARNLHEFVYNIVKLLPNSRSSRIAPANAGSGPLAPVGTTAGPSIADSPILGPARKLSAIGTIGTPLRSESSSGSASPPNDPLQEKRTSVERQSALFSNTVPQDVLNLATTIQLREPVRVLVRRDGTVTNIETSPNFRGLRQYYLYLAFTAGGSRQDSVDGGLGIIGSGRGTTSAESIQAREWKLDALVDILEDLDIMQALVHVGSVGSLDAVVYKLASRGFEAIPLHGEMSSATKLSAMSKFKSNPSAVMRQSSTKVLVVYDVHTQELNHLPLIINYDLPKAVEEYTHRTAPAVAPNNYTRGGVIINFVTATGGDVEMLRSIECFHKIKCPEVPLNLRDLV